MPSWKKVIVSGSSAALPSITHTGDFTIDASGDIILDADGTDILLKDNGTEFGRFKIASSDFVIKSAINNKDILFKGQDGGATITALQLDMSEAGSVFMPNDNAVLGIGAGNDLRLFHDGTDSYIYNYEGNLNIANTVDDADTVLLGDDGSGGNTAYITLDGSASDIKVAQHMQFADNKELRIGNDNDLRLVSNNSNTFIDNYLGNMYIRQTVDDGDMFLQCDNGSGGLANYITLDGGAGTVEIGKDTNVDGTLTSTGDVVAFYSSDERLKDNITNIHKPLAKIDKIGGYKFTWNDKQDTYLGKDVGVLAQEIEAIMPEVVTTRKNGYKAVKYEKIVPLLIEGIKELNKKIEDIEKNCDCLKK